jgi:plasmid stabilization system protein ParE
VARLVFAPSAIADTREILATLVEKAGRPVAVAYFERFRSTFERIAAFRNQARQGRASAPRFDLPSFAPTS